MTAQPDEQDPRTLQGDICGVSYTSGVIEWVCIAKPHDTEKQRSARPSKPGYYPKSQRHYFVNRYPGRASA